MQNKELKITDLEILEKKLKKRVEEISGNKLFIAEEKLSEHLTENEILELIAKGVIEDKSLS